MEVIVCREIVLAPARARVAGDPVWNGEGFAAKKARPEIDFRLALGQVSGDLVEVCAGLGDGPADLLYHGHVACWFADEVVNSGQLSCADSRLVIHVCDSSVGRLGCLAALGVN